MSTPSEQPRRDNSDRQTTPQQGAPAKQAQPTLPMQEDLTPEERSAISQGASGQAGRPKQTPKLGEQRRGTWQNPEHPERPVPNLDEDSPAKRTSSRQGSGADSSDDDNSDVDRNL